MTHPDDHEAEHDAAVEQLPDGRALEADEPHEHAPNPTQERIDEEEESGKPVDVAWEGDAPA